MSRNLLKAALPVLWRRFLRTNFAGPREVSLVFGVSVSTAYLWWAGDAAPAAEHVIGAYESARGDSLRAEIRREVPR